MPDKLDPAAAPPTHFRWNVFALACGTSWLLYVHRYTFALIKPKLVEEWGLDKAELGALDSAFALFYTGFQIPLGALADAAGVHLVLTGLILTWSVGLGMHAWAPSERMLLLARAVLGVGQSAVFAAQSRISRTWFPASVRTTVQGWLGVFFGRFGGLSANLLVGSLLLGVFVLPWRTVIYGLAAIGAVQALLFAALYRNDPRKHPLVNAAEADLIAGGDVPGKPASASSSSRTQRLEKASLSRRVSLRPMGDGPSASRTQGSKKASMRDLLRRMSLRSIGNLLALNVQTIFSTLADNIYSAWIPLFLWEVHQLEFKEMGFYSALPLLGGALGGASGGWLNDRLIQWTGNRRWSRTLVGGIGKGTAGGLLLFSLLFYDQPRLFCVMLFFVKYFSDWSLTTTWGVVTDIGGSASATVFAFNNSVAGVGSIAGPWLYGMVALHFGWTPVFVTGAIAYLLCAGSWLFINSELPVVEAAE